MAKKRTGASFEMGGLKIDFFFKRHCSGFDAQQYMYINRLIQHAEFREENHRFLGHLMIER